MEWWTGEKWSEDKNILVELCKRDDNIKIEGYDNDF
jgi:hypothetical protein